MSIDTSVEIPTHSESIVKRKPQIHSHKIKKPNSNEELIKHPNKTKFYADMQIKYKKLVSSV